MTAHPYGICQCRDCDPFDGGCGWTGPVAYEVMRNGTRINVCTRCILESDDDRVLLVRPNDPPQVFFEYDPLGALLVLSTLWMTGDE